MADADVGDRGLIDFQSFQCWERYRKSRQVIVGDGRLEQCQFNDVIERASDL